MENFKKIEIKKLSKLALGNLIGGMERSKYADGSKDQFKQSGDDCCDYRFKPDGGSWGDWGENDGDCKW